MEIYQLTTGLFTKQHLPAYDITILDQRNRPIVLARLFEPGHTLDNKFLQTAFKNFVQKAQSEPGLINGLFLCLPKPFPETMLESIHKLIDAKDPVGRYESKLPPPLAIPIDLLEIERQADGTYAISLVHPNLTPSKLLRKGLSATDDI